MGLIGRRCTAAMPSRPVLIGRGLVPTPYKTHHHEIDSVPLRCPRPHAVPRPHTHRVVARNTLLTEDAPPEAWNTPNERRVGCVCSARVTAAIAKGKHPVPYRTRKLSLSAPMVLQPRGCGRVGRRRTYIGRGAA